MKSNVIAQSQWTSVLLSGLLVGPASAGSETASAGALQYPAASQAAPGHCVNRAYAMKSMRLIFFIVLAFFANAVLAAPCATKEGEAKRECIKQSRRDNNFDYVIIGGRGRIIDGETSEVGFIEYRSREFAKCTFGAVPSDATIFPKWERAQNAANICELEMVDNCSQEGCRINFFVVVRIPEGAMAMGPQITDWKEQSIESLLNIAPEHQ